MSKAKHFLLLFFVGIYGLYAQKYELGEVTIEELQETTHPTEPDAPAAVLYKKGVSYIDYSQSTGFNLVTEVETKIKIYTKDGYEYANKTIPYYNDGSSRESVNVTKAVTYNLVDGKIEKTKLKKEGEFTDKLNKYYSAQKIVMPDVKEGSIIEYKYSLRSPFETALPDWRFQDQIPVNHSEFKTRIPEYYVFNQSYRGWLIPKIETENNSKSILFSGGNNITYTEKATTYTLDNIPAIKDEAYVNNIANYLATIEFELSLTKFPNSMVKTYSTNWEEVAKTIYKYESFGPELEKEGYYDDDVDALTAGLKTHEEKAYAIFAYVKNRMHWNEYYGYTCDDGVKTAYKEKVGNVAEINLMLTSMLRYAGIDANPILISTRSNKIALFPSRTAFNYVIAGAEINGNVILFDATSKNAMPNILPTRAINWVGRMITKNGTTKDIDLIPKDASKEVIMLTGSLDENGTLTGKVRDQYYDYNAYLFNSRYSDVDKDTYIEKLEKQYEGIIINKYNVTADDASKPLSEEYDFSHNNTSEIIGDKIYLNPMLFFTRKENPFKQEDRKYPVDFIFPFQHKYVINFTIPDGYEVESLPQPAALGMEQNIGVFRYNIGQTKNIIQVMVNMDINYANISAEYYPTIKNFFQQMVEKQSEKIVLKKSL